MNSRRTSPTDAYVGERLKTARLLGGISQEQLGEAVGITFQQIQKYERGLNRISAGRLYEFAKILGVDIVYFYEGIEKPNVQSLAELTNANDSSAEVNSLIRAYSKIKDDAVRQSILHMVQSMPKKA